MAWDAHRPVPWKRLGFFLALYAGVMVAVTAISNRDNLESGLFSVAFGAGVAAIFLVVLIKFGWTMPILRSREEIAQVREERLAARRATKGGSSRNDKHPIEAVEGPRPKPAPTSRTTTGPSQHPRRTSATRRK